MSKAKFLVARELIKEENYEAARALLVTIDHPLAADWLAKLDRLAPPSEGSAQPAIEPDAQAVAAAMPNLDDLAAEPDAARPAPSRPQPALVEKEPEFGAPPDAEVAPVAPNPIPAPAKDGHAQFRRPGTESTAPKPATPEPTGRKNVSDKAGGKSGAQKAAGKPASKSAAPAATNKAGATAVVPVAPAPPLTGSALWKARASWLLLGTPLPGQEEKAKAEIHKQAADDHTPDDDDDEAVDWHNLPSHANGGQIDDMPWLSGKLDQRSPYRPVATLSTGGLPRKPSGDGMEWEFASEMPFGTPQPDLDTLTRVDFEAVSDQRRGRKLLDGFNFIFIGVLFCGLFAFLVASRQAATPPGEVYSVGIFELLVIGSGITLIVLGIWRFIKPEPPLPPAPPSN